MAIHNAENYSRVDPQYLGIPSKHIEKDGEKEILLEVGSSSDWKILVVHMDNRVCHAFKGYPVPFYSCIFYKLVVRLPLTTFEKGVLDHLRVPSSQLHPCAWAFLRVF